jgi:hypothetical protein
MQPVSSNRLPTRVKGGGVRKARKACRVEVESQELFTVQEILDERGSRKKKEYLVSWLGYGPEENTWEPAMNLKHNCMLAAWKQRQRSAHVAHKLWVPLPEPSAGCERETDTGKHEPETPPRPLANKGTEVTEVTLQQKIMRICHEFDMALTMEHNWPLVLSTAQKMLRTKAEGSLHRQADAILQLIGVTA